MTNQELWAKTKLRLIQIAGSEEKAHFTMACYQASVLLDGSTTKDIAEMLIKGVAPSPTIDDFIDVEGYVVCGEDDVDSFNDLLMSIEAYFIARC